MGRLTRNHQRRLDDFIVRLDERLKKIGRPHESEIQRYTIEFLQTFVDEVEAGQYQGGSFLKNSIAHIWKAISETIILNFPEDHRPISDKDRQRDIRLQKKFTKARFFWDPTFVHDFALRYDWRQKTVETDLYQKLKVWRDEADSRSSNEARDRRSFKFEWGESEYERLYALALECLRSRSKVQTDAERCVRLIFGLSFFTGRRPWEEVGRISVFHESEPPDDNPDVEHADDWLEVVGIGKKKMDNESSVIIPVFGISSRELVEALVELRMIESGKTWFSLTRDKAETASSLIIGALSYQWRKFCDAEVEPCFERSLAAGYNFDHNASKNSGVGRFNAYDLRRLYVSYAFSRYCEFCEENGIRVPQDPIDYAAMILGHSTEGVSDLHTLTYTLFRYRGSEPLNDAGVKNDRFSRRQLVTSC